MSVQVPADGDPTYYSSDINATYYGAYDGYGYQDAARTAVYREELVWSGGTGFWDVYNTFGLEYGPFGGESSAEIGISRVERTRDALRSFSRTGAEIHQPDNSLALTSQAPDAPVLARAAQSTLSFDRQPLAASAQPSQAANDRGIDRRLVTPAAAQRTLVNLRRNARHVGVDGHRLMFEMERAQSRLTLTFDNLIGAVTHVRMTEPSGTVAETEYSYTPATGAFVLTLERTRVEVPGQAPLTIVRRHSAHQVR